MHVLILALCRGIVNTKLASLSFLAKWFSHSFDRTILRKKEQWRKPSCPVIFGYLKRQLELLIFYKCFY